MLGMKTYAPEYIQDCRARVERDLAAYAGLEGAATEALETSFFNNMVLLLDYFFVHRLRVVEGKDGNALNEVRVLSNSLLNNKGMMTTENVSDTTAYAGLGALKLSPEKSVLNYRTGDEVKVRQADFVRLSGAFFAEMERRFL